jgi:hypothetical protein
LHGILSSDLLRKGKDFISKDETNTDQSEFWGDYLQFLFLPSFPLEWACYFELLVIYICKGCETGSLIITNSCLGLRAGWHIPMHSFQIPA